MKGTRRMFLTSNLIFIVLQKEELLAGIRNGDPKPVRALLREYHGWIRTHLRSILLEEQS